MPFSGAATLSSPLFICLLSVSCVHTLLSRHIFVSSLFRLCVFLLCCNCFHSYFRLLFFFVLKLRIVVCINIYSMLYLGVFFHLSFYVACLLSMKIITFSLSFTYYHLCENIYLSSVTCSSSLSFALCVHVILYYTL